MFVNLNMFKIGQNKWACGANQMVCLEKFLEDFDPGITRRCPFQDTTSSFLAYTRCQDFGHTTAWAFPTTYFSEIQARASVSQHK